MKTTEFNDERDVAAMHLAPEDGVQASEPKPMLTGPKRQHFLPRFYLEGFADSGMVAVYDREKNETRIQQPVNTGVIGHFYTMTDEQGRKRYELEQLLSEYEGKAKPIIDKLTAREPLTENERADLAVFLALGTTRTPDIVDSVKAMSSQMVQWLTRMTYSDVEEVFERLRADETLSGRSDAELRDEAKLMVELVQSDALKVETNEKWAVGMAFKMAMEIAPIFAARDWVVCHRDNEKKSFVTTDAPVFLTTVASRSNSFYGIGFGNSDALVFFPLNKACMLAMHGNNGDLRHMEVGTDRIRRLNLAMASECQRFVIGRSEALVRSLADTVGLARKEWQPKMQAR